MLHVQFNIYFPFLSTPLLDHPIVICQAEAYFPKLQQSCKSQFKKEPSSITDKSKLIKK